MKKTLISFGGGLSMAIINFYLFVLVIGNFIRRHGSYYWASRFKEVIIVLMIITNLIFLQLFEKWMKARFKVSVSNNISILISLIFGVLFCIYTFFEDPFGIIPCSILLFVVFSVTISLEITKILVKRYIKQKNE